MISIVMAFHNRLPLLEYTLSTFNKSSNKDFEVVIVDDYSSQEHSLDNIKNKYSNININIINMRDIYKEKIYYNPCIPFNVGFRKSKGDCIIIQNPECCHVGDVISHVEHNLTNSIYLSFNCYSTSDQDTKALHVSNTISNIKNIGASNDGDSAWYNHPIYRPYAYHFTSGITRKNLTELNGFDEKYAHGHGYDDSEFIQRIRIKNLKVSFVNTPFVVHQFHYSGERGSLSPTQNNATLFRNTVNENTFFVKNAENIT